MVVKWLLCIVGALVALMGLVWTGQGLGFMPGSFMSGRIEWAAYGLLAVAIGAAVVAPRVNVRRVWRDLSVAQPFRVGCGRDDVVAGLDFQQEARDLADLLTDDDVAR